MSQTSRTRSVPHIFDNSIYFDTSESDNTLLIIGPNPTMCTQAEHGKDSQKSSRYLSDIVTKAAEWCIDRNIIQQKYVAQEDIVKEFHQLLEKHDLRHASYKLQEYLTEKTWLQQCFREIVYSTSIPDNYLSLVRMSFRGYISTTYDLLLETAYEQVHHEKLPKYYASSIREAIEACQQKRPFLFKPYGDSNDPESIVLGSRIMKGLFSIDKQEALRTLLTMLPIAFTGFDRDDQDFKACQHIIKQSSKTKIDQHTLPVLQRYEMRTYIVEDQPPLQNEKFSNELHITSQRHPDLILSPTINKNSFQNALANPASRHTQAPASTSRTQNEGQNGTGQTRPIEVFRVSTDKDKKYSDKIDEIIMGIKNNSPYLCIDYSKESVHPSASTPLRIKEKLTATHLVLLLVSRTFVATDFSNCKQMQEVVERCHSGYLLLPIFIHPIDYWAFKNLEGLPEGGKALSEMGSKQNNAYNEIGKRIIDVIKELRKVNNLH